MRGYIKYFDNGGENMSFTIEDENLVILWLIKKNFMLLNKQLL